MRIIACHDPLASTIRETCAEKRLPAVVNARRFMVLKGKDTGACHGLGQGATKTYRFRENLKRYWQTEIWAEVYLASCVLPDFACPPRFKRKLSPRPIQAVHRRHYRTKAYWSHGGLVRMDGRAQGLLKAQYGACIEEGAEYNASSTTVTESGAIRPPRALC
ncbi:uncharacterized protein MYCGRDRAFT_98128 [Zymoseptoria tritici IPO323]|uniref:Uncharacterized protein n=1 Tax=Zymoseptoria tritici (strain CBS 115943 / IPO323) TaxID=336722 RepID=F9XSD8_ZYMTI|nr:uncharacterized protein MYCGRDRAFT_98128 [Zymoseptoria tritici IPO323]EGP81848.1 hypothetical protein MYCGRDRAFT_98128 [Zymoseptoria tritici IPO323]